MKRKSLIEEIFKLESEDQIAEVFSTKKYNEKQELNEHLIKHLENLNFETMTKI